MPQLKRLPAAFYATASGREPVRDWLKTLGKEDRQTIGTDIAMAEFGWPVGMPLCRSLGKGLWEIRSDLSQGRTARVIFAIVGEHLVLLHGFVKKAQKTPKPDLEIATKRLRELSP